MSNQFLIRLVMTIFDIGEKMRKISLYLLSLLIFVPTMASSPTEQLANGVVDIKIYRTEFKIEKCDAYVCNVSSTDGTTRMELKRATLSQHVSKDLNFLLDIEFDSKLFKSGLLVQYYNDKNLIRVYLKGADMTIEATRKDEIRHLQNWLRKTLTLIASEK